MTVSSFNIAGTISRDKRMRDLVIIGCGGFGREVFDVVRDINSASPLWNLIGFVDDDPSATNRERVEQLGAKILGSVSEAILALSAPYYVVAIGNGGARRRLSSQLGGAGWDAAILIHPASHIGSSTQIGAGSIVCQGAAVTSNVVLGRFVHIDRGSQVGHDCRVADFATLNPMVTVSGDCQIGEAANLGTGATVLPGIRVGHSSVVGASACVVRDVADSSVVKGVPAA